VPFLDVSIGRVAASILLDGMVGWGHSGAWKSVDAHWSAPRFLVHPKW
jgi:hypothetical protein